MVDSRTMAPLRWFMLTSPIKDRASLSLLLNEANIKPKVTIGSSRKLILEQTERKTIAIGALSKETGPPTGPSAAEQELLVERNSQAARGLGLVAATSGLRIEGPLPQ